MDDSPPSPPPEPALRVRLLGVFTVAIDGVEVAAERWPSLRSAQLVQLLALDARHRLAREQVIDALWPQLDPEAGAANLRKAAHHARQALGRQDALVLQGGEVALFPQRTVSVDAQVFESRARAALSEGDAAACAEAAALYRGALLPGSRYEPWAEAARERAHALHIALLRRSGQWEALARAEPTDEPAHRALIARELAAGNRAAAIGWYAQLRHALQRTLGVTPERETEALYERCLAGLRDAGPALVGREWLVAQVLAALAEPPARRAGGVLLRGDAGIGKSALRRELHARAAARDWSVATVEAVEPDRPYAAVAALAERLLLEDRARLDAVGAPARAVLALLTPLAAPADELPGPLGRHQVIGALRRLLVQAAEGRPGVMVQVDDAHRLGDADVDVLLQLATAAAPVFVCLAARTPLTPSSALARGSARLAAAGVITAIDLGPLADADAATLVAQAAPRALATDELVRIVRQAEGHPFAAIELSRCATAESAGTTRLPPTVAAAITERLLADLPVAALPLLEWLALAGDDFDAATAAALPPHEEGDAFALLDAALGAGVLVVRDARYRFRHELVRQALIDRIAPHQRLKMHRQAAARLAELALAPAQVARHWQAGGSPREALPHWLAATREAMAVAAFADALRCVAPVLAFDGGHAEALRLRAEALDALGDAAALPAYRAAADAAGEPLAHDLRAKGALAQVKQGDPKGALEALAGLRPSTVEGRLAEALAYSGAAALGAIGPEIGSAKSAEARRLALQTGDTASIVVASWAHAAAAHARGELYKTVWADLDDTRDMPLLATRVFDGQLCMTQRFLYGARPYADVIAFASELAAHAQRLGSARGHAFGITTRGEAELLSGDLAAAELHLREGVRLHRAIGGAVGEAYATQRLAEAAMARGRRDDARKLLDHALDLARQTDIGFHLFDRIYGARVALADDPQAGLHALADAHESVRGPLETCPGCRITLAVPAAIAAARGGDLEQAEQFERQTAYLADVVMRLPAWYAAHDEVKAHLALARGDRAAARERFATAAARFRVAGQPLDAARCDALASAE